MSFAHSRLAMNQFSPPPSAPSAVLINTATLSRGGSEDDDGQQGGRGGRGGGEGGESIEESTTVSPTSTSSSSVASSSAASSSSTASSETSRTSSAGLILPSMTAAFMASGGKAGAGKVQEEKEEVRLNRSGERDVDSTDDEMEVDLSTLGERRDSQSVTVGHELSQLSVHSRTVSAEGTLAGEEANRRARGEDDIGDGERKSRGLEKGTTTTKSRRASTLSSTSSVEDASSYRYSIGGSTSGVGERDPSKPARRKSARTTSFRRSHSPSTDAASHTFASSSASTSTLPIPHTYSLPPLPPSLPAPSSSTSTSKSKSSTTTNNPPHVDIVSYPSTDLLRLLAALLEQIARANDALHQRTLSANQSKSNSGTNTPAGGSSRNRGMKSSIILEGGNIVEGEEGKEGQQEEERTTFERGRFDAAPLNSPVTPRWSSRYYNNGMETESIDQLSSGTDYDAEGEDVIELPVTPGIDLLREVGEGGGAKGFMPSLGGAHTPMPLERRRGSSFTKLQQEEGGQLSSFPPTISTAASTSTEPLTSLLTASSLALASPSATLCFHARNIPGISIEAYLLRILKYCPTTNEVFLSLLVYFDRMARVGLEAQRVAEAELLGSNSEMHIEGGGAERGRSSGTPRLFSIDSFNVHRLLIAGVTVASKFFSDVFYTNSRYAKVGGLPLNELNQLELQFLLLNDFRLVIPLDELQRYADQLILFWIGKDGGAPLFTPPLATASPMPMTREEEMSSSTTTTTTDSFRSDSSTRSIPMSLPQQQQQYQQHLPSSSYSHHSQQQQQQNQHHHSTPHSRSTSIERPTSIRSQPSSSGTSVTSTITPGTPTTPREGSEMEPHGFGSSYHHNGGEGDQ